jgi:FtsP/CotA-like multicopper oxidase with cupredoxin domain
MNMTLPMKNVNVTIKADAKPGSDGKTHDAFFPTTNLSVKAGQRVRVTIYNYDDMPHSFTSPGLAKGAAIPAAEQQTQGTAQDIKVMPAPGVGVDKMIPAGSDKRPSKTIVTFTAPNGTGSYIWYCKLPCDPWAMSHLGYMVGRVNVTAA